MSEHQLPWLALSIASLFTVGAYFMRTTDGQLARRVAGALLFTLLVASAWACFGVYASDSPGRSVDPLELGLLGAARPLLGLDPLNAALLPFTAFAGLAIVIGTPRRWLTSRQVGTLLVQLGAAWGLYTALDLAALAAFWVCGLMPLYADRREVRRLPLVYMTVAAIAMFLALALIVTTAMQSGVAAPSSLLDLRTGPTLALPLLLIAVVFRKGAFPFHSWLPTAAERLSPPAFVMLTVPQFGAFMLLRVAVPLFPEAMSDVLPLIARFALFGALYASVVALGAKTLRRAFGWLVASHSVLVLVGLECTTVDGIAGGLTLWISMGWALTGLAIAIAAVESRIGQVSLARFHGLGQRAPWLGGLFLLLGLSAVGLPGSLGFVAEDMLVHGALDSYPGIGALIVLAAAANGYTVVRLFVRVFYGPVRPDLTAGDVLDRERWALLALAVALLGFGLAPSPVISTRVPTAIEVASTLRGSL